MSAPKLSPYGQVVLAIYSSQTATLLDTYRARGLLFEVDGLADVGGVSARIFQALTLNGS
jgi:hypothetical protein